MWPFLSYAPVSLITSKNEYFYSNFQLPEFSQPNRLIIKEAFKSVVVDVVKEYQ
jgi:hypothetical protein